MVKLRNRDTGCEKDGNSGNWRRGKNDVDMEKQEIPSKQGKLHVKGKVVEGGEERRTSHRVLRFRSECGKLTKVGRERRNRGKSKKLHMNVMLTRSSISKMFTSKRKKCRRKVKRDLKGGEEQRTAPATRGSSAESLSASVDSQKVVGDSADASYEPYDEGNEKVSNASEDEGTSGQVSLSSSDDIEVDEQSFPKRLFATDRYPTKGRVNSYSKLQYLVDIVEILEGTPEYNLVMDSPLGSLFSLQVRMSSLCGKLVHNILCRQLLTNDPDELWFTFGGQPLRFSLVEFEKVTRLPCGNYPAAEAIAAAQAVGESEKHYWDTLLGPNRKMTVKDIVGMLKADPGMDGERRLRLVLIVLVEGILTCGRQPVRPSLEVVEMVRDVNFFLAYPWGRHSFELTLRMIKVGSKVRRTADIIKKLKQQSVVIHGFPIAIQFFVFERIPLLLQYLPRADDRQTFLDRGIGRLRPLRTYHTENILQVENSNELVIESCVVPVEHHGEVSIPSPSNVDPRVIHLQTLLEGGFIFSL